MKTAIEGGYVSAEFAAKREGGRDPAAPDADRRTVQQIQADALVHFAEHALTCLRNTTLNGGATVVVRVNQADLETGTGFGGVIDGITQPVSIDTVRRMAGGGSTVTWVCGNDGGEVLTWGGGNVACSAARSASRSPNATAGARSAGCHRGG